MNLKSGFLKLDKIILVACMILAFSGIVFAATFNVDYFTVGKLGSGIAGWIDSDYHTGSKAVRLKTINAFDYSYDALKSEYILLPATIDNINSLTYWYKHFEWNSTSNPGPRISILLENGGNYYNVVSGGAVGSLGAWSQANGITGQNITTNTTGSPDEIWWYGDCSDAYCSSYIQQGGPVNFSIVQGLYSGYNIKSISVYMGLVVDPIGPGEAYIDDITINGITYYGSIQDVISDASPNDVINVYPGTYVERLVIGKKLTINCTGNAVIQPDAVPAAGVYDVEIDANNTIIQNCVFDFNGADDTRGGNGIVVSDMNEPAVTGVKILNNTIYTGDASGVGGTGIQTGKYSDVSNLLISGNYFYGDISGMGEGVYINPHNGSNVTIVNNRFYGNLYSGISIEASSVNATNNIINSNATLGVYGIRVIDTSGGQTFNQIDIRNNNIQNVGAGIRVGTNTNVGSLLSANIIANIITSNTLGISAKYGASLTIKNNSIYGNTVGINSTSVLDAESNWWGVSTGPSSSAISSNVDYEPFCKNSGCTAIAIGGKPDGFPGAGSTNFSAVTNFSSVSLSLDNGVSVLVNFSHNVNLSSSTLDFDKYISMATGYISIDITGMPELNTPATIRFTGIISQTAPVIYRDGKVCPSSICSNIVYDSNTSVLTFTVTGFSTYYVSSGISIGVDRLNYWEQENHTVSLKWTGGGLVNFTALIPAGWEFVSGSGCTNISSIVTCNNVANNSLVSFVINVIDASAHPEFEISYIKINATSGGSTFYSPDLRIIRIQDHNIFHTLVEYGRGRGDYFFDTYSAGTAGSGHTGVGCSYLPANTTIELNFLHKMVNIKEKFKIANANAENATFSCTYPNKNVVRIHSMEEIQDLGDLVRVDYLIPEIEGSWERMGYLGIDFATSDYGVNDSITINCTNIKYSLPGAYGDVIVDNDAFTLDFRNKNPFVVSASGTGVIGNGSQEMEITYNITNLEQYSISDMIIEIKAPQYATFIGVRGELWGTSLEKYRLERIGFAPGETEQITLVARFNTSGAQQNMTSLPFSDGINIQYVPCWESNSYNPTKYTQYLTVNGNGTVNMSQSSEVINIIQRIIIIQRLVVRINDTVTEINVTLSEFYNYMNNTIWKNLTAEDLLEKPENDTGDIINELKYIQGFNEELAFLVTDSFNSQQEARNFLKSGDVDSAAQSLTDARDKLQQAASLLQKEQDALNRVPGSKFTWKIPLLVVILITTLILFYNKKRLFLLKKPLKKEDKKIFKSHKKE